MSMIAKFQVVNVKVHKPADDAPTSQEDLEFSAVTEKPFNPDGESDDNSFARWTPTGNLKMTVTNPALFGKFERGQKYYLTFEKEIPALTGAQNED